MASCKPDTLDRVLGSRATVRVLRVLISGGEHAPPRIARETNVSRPAVREAIIRLEVEGIVERVGDGRNVLYRLSASHPLARRIVKLFRAEARRGAVTVLMLIGALQLPTVNTTNPAHHDPSAAATTFVRTTWSLG